MPPRIRWSQSASIQKEVRDMANVDFELDTDVPAAEILQAATDFSERRTTFWPTIEPGVYQVHGRGDTWTEATEGSRFLGTIWARERYDWGAAGTVRATVLDSNVFRAGGTWALEAVETDGRTRVRVRSRRQAASLRGRILGALLAVAGRSILTASFQRTLDILAADPA
jgi:hypothetical protein